MPTFEIGFFPQAASKASRAKGCDKSTHPIAAPDRSVIPVLSTGAGHGEIDIAAGLVIGGSPTLSYASSFLLESPLYVALGVALVGVVWLFATRAAPARTAAAGGLVEAGLPKP